MIKIDPVWESTTDTLARRTGPIATIAALAFVVPPIVQQGVLLALGPRGVAVALVAAVFALVSAAAAIWGQLAVTALAIDPGAGAGAAMRQAAARWLALVGVGLVITVAALLLLAPLGVLPGLYGVDFAQLRAGGDVSTLTIPRGVLAFLALYGIVLAVAALWVSARLLLTSAVVLAERRGLGAIGRSVTLTRRSTWRLVGVVLLFMVALGIATFAAQAVVGLVARLIVGDGHPLVVGFVAGVAGSIVTALFLSLAYVFVGRAYVFARQHEEVPG